MEERVYKHHANNVDKLKQRVLDVCMVCSRPSLTRMEKRLTACVYAQRRHVEHSLRLMQSWSKRRYVLSHVLEIRW